MPCQSIVYQDCITADPVAEFGDGLGVVVLVAVHAAKEPSVCVGDEDLAYAYRHVYRHECRYVHRHVCRAVCRDVRRHVYRHVYRHVHRHVLPSMEQNSQRCVSRILASRTRMHGHM